MMEKLQKILITRTFAFAWLGLIFATQAGSHVGDGGTLGTFFFHFLNIALAGYIVGFAIGNHMYSGLVQELVDANHSLAEGMQAILGELEKRSHPMDDGTASREE